MSKIKIRYVLSEAGQKASLLAGGDGRQVQEIDCPDDVLPQALPLASMYGDGTGVVDVGGWKYVIRDGRIVGVCGGPSRPTTEYEIKKDMDSYLVTGWGYQKNQWFEYPVVRIVEQTGEGVLLYDVPTEAELLVAGEAGRRVRLATMKAAIEARFEPLRTEAAAKKAEAQAAHDAAWEKEKRQRQQDDDDRDKRETEKEAKKAEKKKAEQEEAVAWATSYGSNRLRAILDAGLLDGSLALYRDERLAVERPGWIYDAGWLDGEVRYRDIRNPSMAALTALREAKAAGIEAELNWAHLDIADEDGYGETVERIREPILTAMFLGRTIVLRLEYITPKPSDDKDVTD